MQPNGSRLVKLCREPQLIAPGLHLTASTRLANSAVDGATVLVLNLSHCMYFWLVCLPGIGFDGRLCSRRPPLSHMPSLLTCMAACRLFLAPYDLTPTYKIVHNKFSVKYYLNLVLVDEEDRRYFKQQEIQLFRLLDERGLSTSDPPASSSPILS